MARAQSTSRARIGSHTQYHVKLTRAGLGHGVRGTVADPDPETILPVQFAGLRGSTGQTKPETLLWIAVLAGAVDDLRLTGTTKRKVRRRRDARQFFLSASLEYVCGYLAIDPDAVRAKLRVYIHADDCGTGAPTRATPAADQAQGVHTDAATTPTNTAPPARRPAPARPHPVRQGHDLGPWI